MRLRGWKVLWIASGTLAGATGARVLVTEDEHLSYPARSAGRVMSALRIPPPAP